MKKHPCEEENLLNYKNLEKNAPARKKFNETAKILKKIAPARKKFNETAKIMKKIAPARKKFDETVKIFEKTPLRGRKLMKPQKS